MATDEKIEDAEFTEVVSYQAGELDEEGKRIQVIGTLVEVIDNMVEQNAEATGSVGNGQETQPEEAKGQTAETTEGEQVQPPELAETTPTPAIYVLGTATTQAKSDDLKWTKEEFDEYDRETIALVNEHAELCKATQSKYLLAKEVASECKKLHEGANKALTDLIEERAKERGKPRQRSLFDNNSRLDVGQQSEPELTATVEVVEPVTEEPVEDTSWRDVEISYLTQHGLSESTANAIEDNGINTIGKLADFTTKNQLTDLKKIGAAKAEAIEKALESFWAERNRPSTVEPSEPEGDEEDIIDGIDEDTVEPSDEPTDEAEAETTQPAFDNIDI